MSGVQAISKVSQEIELSWLLAKGSKHVVPAIGFSVSCPDLYLLLPFCARGSLYNSLSHKGSLTVHQRVQIAADMADAVAYMHKLSLVHR